MHAHHAFQRFDTPADLYVGPAWAAYLGDPELALDLMRKSSDPWAF